MRIKYLTADSNWQKRLEDNGFGFHTDENNVPYWIEHYYYSISPEFADKVYNATTELWQMCLEAVDHVITNKLFDQFQIPIFFHDHITKSWENDAPSIYGRFDFVYDDIKQQLKVLEFNADTPTSLYETGVTQWQWMQHYFRDRKDQFNSVHDRLIESWKELKPYLKGDTLHFSCMRETLEDLTNVEYLRDTAIQAGINTQLIYIDDIGWNGVNFTDLNEDTITDIFKLYPWEWLVYEPFALHIPNDEAEANWIEPSWKMILSNKAIMAVLWQLYPNHPLLLETYFDTPNGMRDYVKKPLLSREGANVTMYKNGAIVEATPGDYGEEGYICQALANLHQETTGYSIIGSWVIGQESCGITFRESNNRITTDKSRFIPHIIEE
ncbi:glutathionylspermidine synthase family protein [Myroides marinus]|uniref:Glutathionylspermidine synthase n=1 Tax=Myroides marinus TaxID=703342 RepID=A0A1H6T7B1_9FLAO|nr:glutathionylspermidine synthase family protein [Myroides marinus]MDM1378990.1 glutathionylspermidine synthase family protein [Myroides marinus]MDM1386261.1 glutathionylspermidine synthase family protein [Myroides marinus]MDM1393474.1 glutathionylspermidine synthase family protein [Myroides marinus]SEI75881.1 Glutathionylspermidine synthase [Myroides marinus]